jgi:arylsulfatase A-like enzyme
LAASERFPHRIAPEPKAEQFSRKLLTTPEADRHLLKLARAAVEAEGLGADDHPDFLAISLSGNDYLLHRYGGGTAEAAESLAAIDAELGGFLAFLEKKMKRDRLVVALVADHGSITPGEAKRLGLRAGHVHPEELKAHLETTLSDKLGKKQPWVQAITDAGIYLLEDAAIDFERVKVIAAEALLREEGVAEVYRRGHLEDWLGTAAGRAALRGYNQKTGGDLVVSLVPSWVWDDEVASHGSPYAYDTRVPMMIRAPGRGAQRVSRRVDPIDLPGTLAALNGMPPPGASEGELLHEAVLR